MNNSANSTESAQPSKMPTPNSGYEKEAPTPEAPVEATPEEKFADDFGYTKPEEEPSTEIAPPEEEEKPEEEKVKDPATGYGEDQKAEEKPAEESKEEEEKEEEEEAPKELDKDTVTKLIGEKLPESDRKLLAEFAVDNKMTKEQVENFVKLREAEDARFIKESEEAKINQRREWKEELLKDGDFGGANFDKSVDRVEKFLDKHMPNMKKVLTERSSVLPPYVMKDFLSLAKLLNPTTELVTGEFSQPKKAEGNFLDDMYQ